MMPPPSFLAALLAAGWAPAQEPLALPAGLAPLASPAAPGGLNGLVLCLDPLPPGTARGTDAADQVLPAALYLERLLRAAGARTALTRYAAWGGEEGAALAGAARAGLLLELAACARPEQQAIRLPHREAADPAAPLEGALAQRLAQELGCAAWSIGPDPQAVPSIPVLRVFIAPRPGSTPGARPHRLPAQALFRALVAWWASRPEAPCPPPETAAPGTPGHPPLTQAEADERIRAWQRGHAADPTQVWLEVALRRTETGWRLEGSSELPLLEEALRGMLGSLGIRPAGSLRLLPEPGAEPRFGLVQVPSALLWSRPGRASGLAGADGPGQVQETQVLYGEPVRILDQRQGSALIHAASGYLGWIDPGALQPLAPRSYQRLLDLPRAVLLAERTAGTIRIPAGAALPLGEHPSGARALELVDGTLLPVGEEELGLPDPGAGIQAARTALDYLGTPYLFGGTAPHGIDCSGLVKRAWGATGLLVPRDARMQVLCGWLVATAAQPARLRPGDLLFFANDSGRIAHVALSLGGSRFVHASPPEVNLGSLDSEDPWYVPVARRFVLAKRPRH